MTHSWSGTVGVTNWGIITNLTVTNGLYVMSATLEGNSAKPTMINVCGVSNSDRTSTNHAVSATGFINGTSGVVRGWQDQGGTINMAHSYYVVRLRLY